MQAPESKQVEFRCGVAGVVSKTSPDLLRDGQYRSLANVTSNQEGSISSRTGPKRVGQIASSETSCWFVRKLCVYGGEDPLVPSLNPRYLDSNYNIYRTLDYNTATLVASTVEVTNGPHWEMADYSAGETGAPWAYFACPKGMFKDSGLSPYGTLPKWGIQAASGVCLAVQQTGQIGVTATAVGNQASNSPVILFLAGPTGIADDDVITFASDIGVVPQTCSTGNGLYYAKVAGYSNVPGDQYYAAYGAGGAIALYDSDGHEVVATGASFTPGNITGIALAGNLNGGATSSANAAGVILTPYDWVMAYEETVTGDKGNPSQTMSTAGTATVTLSSVTYSVNPLALNNGIAQVVLWYTPDTRIGFIRLYRRGGNLSDGIWRLVARIPNVTSGAPAPTVITDNTADDDLVYADQLESDNTPPIVSTVPTPITSTLSSGVSASSTGTPFPTATLAASVLGSVQVGNLIHITDGESSEDVYALTVSAGSFTAFFQFAHGSGVSVTVDAIYGQPCNLALTMEESILVAGDPNNPHVLYKSKTGFPQAFPIGTDAAGAITSVGVGSPTNGIVNMTECRGQVLCLNVSALFQVIILSGSLYSPQRCAEKGLRGQSAFCKTDTGEVWFKSDDGVYSWDGASLRKRSEQIDPLFHSQQYNHIAPLDSAYDGAARMEFHRGIIHLLYYDTNGFAHEWTCEPMYGDRWIPINQEVGGAPSASGPVTMLYQEPDTKSLIVAVTNSGGAMFGIADAIVPPVDPSETPAGVADSFNLTSDWWTNAPGAGSGGGSAIAWDIRLPWFDMGDPASNKLFEEVWLDIDPELYTTAVYSIAASITVELLLNYSDTVVDKFSIAIPSGVSFNGRQLISLLPNLVSGSGINQSYGREARAISFHLYGSAFPIQFALYRVLCQYQPTGVLSAGSATDWMDLGSKHDKRLYQMTVVFDTAGTDRQLVLETRGGREGKTAGTPQVFTLSSPTDLGSGRCMKVFALADPTVGKLMRVRPYTSASIAGGTSTSSIDLFRILEVTFPDAEEYPPDIVVRAGDIANGKVTKPWTTGGYDYDKYGNQVTFEVNTNGVAVTVQLQADGANIGNTFTLTTTDTDRRRNITLPSGLKGKFWSTFVDPTQAALTSGAGMFQLFNLSWKFQQADKGEVGHTFDWDDLAHPWDKYLRTVTVEWDDTGGSSVTLQLDTISGIGGQTLTSDIMAATPIALSGGRGKQVFALPPDTIAKLIRLYPKGSTIASGYKQWKYSFDKIDYPADTILSTEWRDAQNPNDKNPSWLWIDADTAGIAASVILQNESGTVMTVSHTGTALNRKVNYPIPVDTYGKMWRLKITPGSSGKYQQFGWGFARWQPTPESSGEDPPEVVLWTPWQDFGYPYEKVGQRLILTINTGGVPCLVELQTQEAGTVQTFSVTTTYTARRVVLPCSNNLIGTQWRLGLTPGDGTGGGGTGVSASADYGLLTATAVTPGVGGNSISFAMVAQMTPGGSYPETYTGYLPIADAELTVTVVGNDIWVFLATDSSGNGTTTAGDVIAAVRASYAASALVTVALDSGIDPASLIGIPNMPYTGGLANVVSPSGYSSAGLSYLGGGQ